MGRPHIGLACMTQRGVAVLRRLVDLRGDAQLTVITAHGESWEPAFVDDLRRIALDRQGHYFEARNLTALSKEHGWQASGLDLLLLVNWRYRVAADIHRAPRRGTFVFHDSLLPAYRGFSPTSWAIINGEDRTGATLFAIADDIDAGDIVGQRSVPIGRDETIATVIPRVTDAYLGLLEDHLESLLEGSAPRRPQNHARATYACKRMPDDNRIDWAASTAAIHNLIRAVSHPYPGAFTTLSGKRLRIWSARRDPEQRRYIGRVPGAVAEVRPGRGTLVLTGDGELLLEQVQLDGGPPVNAADLIDSLRVRLGP